MAILAASCGPASQPAGPTRLPELELPEAEWPEVELIVTVTRVGDGDSFRDESTDGEIEARLAGINSPELDECHGRAARDALRDMIEGRTIGLVAGPEFDQFDRVLARAVVDDVYVNLAMVLGGHSLVVSEPGPDRNSLVEAEAIARAGEAGWWAGDVCGAAGPRAGLEIIGIDYDPSGPDDNESVVIANTGSSSLNLEGFVLRDESSVNRLKLPPLVLDPGAEVEVVRTCDTAPKNQVAWCSDQPVWNNDGDTALLLDPFGRIVAFLRY